MKKIVLFIVFFGYCCYGEKEKEDKLGRQMMGFGGRPPMPGQPNIGNYRQIYLTISVSTTRTVFVKPLLFQIHDSSFLDFC